MPTIRRGMQDFLASGTNGHVGRGHPSARAAAQDRPCLHCGGHRGGTRCRSARSHRGGASHDGPDDVPPAQRARRPRACSAGWPERPAGRWRRPGRTEARLAPFSRILRRSGGDGLGRVDHRPHRGMDRARAGLGGRARWRPTCRCSGCASAVSSWPRSSVVTSPGPPDRRSAGASSIRSIRTESRRDPGWSGTRTPSPPPRGQRSWPAPRSPSTPSCPGSTPACNSTPKSREKSSGIGWTTHGPRAPRTGPGRGTSGRVRRRRAWSRRPDGPAVRRVPRAGRPSGVRPGRPQRTLPTCGRRGSPAVAARSRLRQVHRARGCARHSHVVCY